MVSKITVSWLLLFVVLFSSCVSKKKFQAATTEAQNAKMANDSLTRKNSELQSQLNDAVSSSKMLAEERDRYQKSADSARQGLTSLQGSVDEYNNALDEMQKKVADRMADYAERGLSVENKNGAVYVNVDDELLFRKGSNRVGKDGETVLGTLASVLNEDPNMKIVVVGHTDDRASGGSDTWTLSTERANNVVRELKSSKIDPARLTSAGQAHYNAIGDNTTAEGRAQNRRTEIILMPETFKLVNKGAGN
jgi:chemotaxis protein MotB